MRELGKQRANEKFNDDLLNFYEHADLNERSKKRAIVFWIEYVQRAKDVRAR